MLILITGASGSGKTFLTRRLQDIIDKRLAHFAFFDEIGVPSLENMILEFGSPEKWQEFATHQWIEKLAQINRNLIILEGQFNPQFAIDALSKNNALHKNGIKNYKIICIHTDKNIRNKRLIEDRMQPELANEDMNNWAEFLKKKTIEVGGIIVENNGDFDRSIKEIASHLGEK